MCIHETLWVTEKENWGLICKEAQGTLLAMMLWFQMNKSHINCMLCSWHIYEKSCSVHFNVIVTTGGTVLSQMIHLDFGEWHCFVSVYFSSPLPHSMKPRRFSCQDGKETYLSNKICLLDIKKKPDQNQAAMLVSLGSLLTSVLHLRTD